MQCIFVPVKRFSRIPPHTFQTGTAVRTVYLVNHNWKAYAMDTVLDPADFFTAFSRSATAADNTGKYFRSS